MKFKQLQNLEQKPQHCDQTWISDTSYHHSKMPNADTETKPTRQLHISWTNAIQWMLNEIDLCLQ